LVYDSSGEGNNGTINGAVYVDAQPRIPQLGMMNWSKGSNLLTYSEDFESVTWGNQSIGTTPTLNGGYTAPDGTNTAYKISNPNKDSFWFTGVGAIADYYRTIWARTVSGTGTAQLTSHNSNTNNTFNLTETWQRFEVNSTTSTTGEQSFYLVDFRGSGTLTELLVWGPQVEDSSSASAYRLTDDGATLNSTVIANPSIPTKDIFGNAVRDRLNSFNLDGSGYAEVADADNLNFGTGDFTLECWVRIDGNTDRRLLDKRNTTSGYTLYLTGSNVLKLELNDGTGNSGFDLTSSLNSNTWLHLAIVCDRSANATCYVNKAAQTPESISSKNGNINSTSNLIVGADAPDGLSLFSTDIISDVRLYDRVLTSDEVENNYNAGLSAHTN